VIGPGANVGRWRLGAARPAPAGFAAWAVEGDDDHELIVPNAHLRLRAGARAAWVAARAARQACAAAALAEADWLEVDGWPCWVRPRAAPLTLAALDPADHPALAGWLAAAGVDLARTTLADLATLPGGEVRYAPLGLAENALERLPALAVVLGPPGAPRAVIARQALAPPAAAPAPPTALAPPAGSALLRLPPAPRAVVMVRLPAGRADLLARVAIRTATVEHEVVRAANRPGWWAWAPATTTGPAARLRGQAERVGLVTELRATGVPSPSFLPALVTGGLAQIPLYMSTGTPALDLAILGGLGATALFSLVRAGRGVAPARASAAAAGAWSAWQRATRTHGPELRLLALEMRLADPDTLGPAATDLADALDAAWTRRFGLPNGEGRAAAELDRLANAVLGALDDTEQRGLAVAIRALGA
jgi:hypothetical protein